MDKKIVIANWKSHKLKKDAENFLIDFSKKILRLNLDNKQITISPSFTLLETCKKIIEKYNLPIKLCAQNISSYPEGAYTGEIYAGQIKEYCDYVLVGHSERRRYNRETEEDIKEKISQAKKSNLLVFQCIQDENGAIHKGADAIAYEPPTAISTFGVGKPDDPKHVEEVFKRIRKKFSGLILYGGSVNKSNVRNYIHVESCGGLLVGGASLDVKEFIELLSQW